ncbi:MAG TPA: STAS domain-containing protein [Trueperaceae bacterium]
MPKSGSSRIPAILEKQEKRILDDWMKQQASSSAFRPDLISETELRSQSKEFLGLLKEAAKDGSVDNLEAEQWSDLRDALDEYSRSRARQGFTPVEVATYIFSLKQSLFTFLRKEYENEPEELVKELWQATTLLDRLGLYTTETYTRSRDEIIERQRQEMLELSTPVVKIWEGVLALPMIGTLDSERAQVVMESLLERIVETGSTIAIVDITGVPTVDTLVAQHLLKTVSAAKLMGADCIISGIRPQIAQTIVHLGIDLNEVTTKASLADALYTALRRTGHKVGPVNS